MHLMIFYPGGVSYGALSDDATNEEIYNVMHTAATIEEGNGNGKIKRRNGSTVDAETGGEAQYRRRNSTKVL